MRHRDANGCATSGAGRTTAARSPGSGGGPLLDDLIRTPGTDGGIVRPRAFAVLRLIEFQPRGLFDGQVGPFAP
jgi:hypothetical protein